MNNKRLMKVFSLFIVVALLLAVPTAGMVEASPGDSWSDNFNGGPQQTWLNVDKGKNSTFTFTNDRYQLHTEYTGTAEGVAASYVNSTAADVIMQAKVQRINPSDKFVAYLIARGNVTENDFYTLGISSGNGTDNEVHLWLGKSDGETYTSFPGGASMLPWGEDNYAWYDCYIKFAIFEDHLMGKAWKVGEPEPDEWQVTATDSSFASGVGGVMVATLHPLGWDTVQAAFDDVSLSVLSQTEVWVDKTWSQAPVKVLGDEIEPGKIFGYNAFATIQEGINAVAAGGTVNVAPGTYNEDLEIGKSITLLGPNAAISPNTGTRVTEAIVAPLNEVGVADIAVLATNGNSDITIKGFTFDMDSTTDPSDQFIQAICKADLEWVIENNIFKNAPDTDIGYWQFTGCGASSTVVIEDNLFTNNGVSNGITMWDANRTVTVKDNVWKDNAGWAVNFNLVTGTFTGNQVLDTVDNGPNWYDDQGGFLFAEENHITMTNNIMDGLPNPYIRIYDTFKGTFNMTGNTLKNSKDPTLGIFRIMSGADLTGFVAEHNAFLNTPLVVQNESTSSLDVSPNWWGCNAGPGNTGCDNVSENVDYDPWLILKITSEKQIVKPNETIQIDANLIYNSAGENTLSEGYVPDGIEAEFVVQHGDEEDFLASETTVKGQVSTTFTPTEGGVFKICVTVDNQTVCTEDIVVPAAAAVADAYRMIFNSTLDVDIAEGVTKNDTGITEGFGYTVSLVSGPTHGQLQLKTDGSFKYIPEADFVGDDSFVYQLVIFPSEPAIANENPWMDQATVTISVEAYQIFIPLVLN